MGLPKQRANEPDSSPHLHIDTIGTVTVDINLLFVILLVQLRGHCGPCSRDGTDRRSPPRFRRHCGDSVVLTGLGLRRRL
jgi:hypothetical protein